MSLEWEEVSVTAKLRNCKIVSDGRRETLCVSFPGELDYRSVLRRNKVGLMLQDSCY